MAADHLSKIMTATDPADVATLAMIEAMRQLSDNGKTTNRILEGMQVELKDVRERVIRIEAAEHKDALVKAEQRMEDRHIRLDARVEDMSDRVDKLEAAEDRRKGALGLADWFWRNWPAVIGFVALIAVLAATGRLSL